jgi:hypothetical protein
MRRLIFALALTLLCSSVGFSAIQSDGISRDPSSGSGSGITTAESCSTYVTSGQACWDGSKFYVGNGESAVDIAAAGTMSWPAAAGIAVYGSEAWDTSITLGTLTNGKWCSYATATGFSCTQDAPTASGTVNSGTQYQLAYYATSAAAISGHSGITTDASGNLNIASGACYQIAGSCVLSKGTDGNRKLTLPNNTAASPTASTDEVYFEANILKVNQNGTESSVPIGPAAGQITFSGPTSARTVTLPDSNIVVVGATQSQTLTNKTLTAASITTKEVDGATDISLSAAQVSGSVVTNYGQTTADVALTLPAAAAGYRALFVVGTAQSNKWGVRAGTNDKIYLVAADGTISAGSDNGYARMTAAQVGQSFTCWTFKTGASEWDWQCKAIAIGTSTFAAN